MVRITGTGLNSLSGIVWWSEGTLKPQLLEAMPLGSLGFLGFYAVEGPSMLRVVHGKVAEIRELPKWLAGIAIVIVRWLVCKADASDEEKEELIGRARVSPLMSPMYAFLHPFVVMRAYKQLKRYQGKTWIWPRLAWLLLLVVCGFFAVERIRDLSPVGSSLGDAVATVVGIYVMSLLVFLVPHFFSTVLMRLNETCVWCHIIQRGPDGSIKATLSIMAYRLPFLDPSHIGVSPWKGDAEAYWKPIGIDVTLETKEDVSQLSFGHIYDETVCPVRGPVAVPPSAKQYVVGKIRRHGDVSIKEKGRFDFMVRPQFRTVVVTTIITGVFAVPSIVLPFVLRLRLRCVFALSLISLFYGR